MLCDVMLCYVMLCYILCCPCSPSFNCYIEACKACLGLDDVEVAVGDAADDVGKALSGVAR